MGTNGTKQKTKNSIKKWEVVFKWTILFTKLLKEILEILKQLW